VGRVLQCIAVRCSVLQCVAIFCSVLQCVAEYCSVSQCVAVCHSMSRLPTPSLQRDVYIKRDLKKRLSYDKRDLHKRPAQMRTALSQKSMDFPVSAGLFCEADLKFRPLTTNPFEVKLHLDCFSLLLIRLFYNVKSH